MIKQLIFIALVAMNATAALAADVTVTGNIVTIQNYEGHDGPLVALNNMTQTSGLCQRNDFYILPLNHQYAAQNYAMLLGAKIAGKTVNITVADGDCVQSLPRIKHISIN